MLASRLGHVIEAVQCTVQLAIVLVQDIPNVAVNHGTSNCASKLNVLAIIIN